MLLKRKERECYLESCRKQYVCLLTTNHLKILYIFPKSLNLQVSLQTLWVTLQESDNMSSPWRRRGKDLQVILRAVLPRSCRCLAGSPWLGPRSSLCTGWRSRSPGSCLVWGSGPAGCGPHTRAAGRAPGPHCESEGEAGRWIRWLTAWTLCEQP